MKKIKFQAPRGMHDILPEQQQYFQKVYSVAEEVANFYGFGKIDTPMLEDEEIFSKGVGLGTDIVEKEMYTLKTKGGDRLALRPEGTASVVRAYIEHGMFNLPKPVKLWYCGPFFRHENPQAGRYRQLHQVGFEILDEKNPVVDAQIIQIFYHILEKLKFKDLIVEINSIGDSQCRPYYKKLLVNFLRSHQSSLCADCKGRLKTNPLRVLDCKQDKCKKTVSQAPQMIDHLCNGCHSHFKEVLEFLDEIELPYSLNPFLVRGLDYYTKTVFEIFEKNPENDSVGSSLLGGGRYDGLAKLLGGRDTPGCGAAAGVERIISSMKGKPLKYNQPPAKRIFLAQLGDLAKRKSLKLFQKFEEARIPVAESFSRDSLKTQLKTADRLGTEYALIIGQKEALEGSVIIRDMSSGKQQTVRMDKAIEEMKKRLIK